MTNRVLVLRLVEVPRHVSTLYAMHTIETQFVGMVSIILEAAETLTCVLEVHIL